MNEDGWLERPRTLGVFDIETVLDPAAAYAAGYKGADMRPALQKVSTACLLTATEQHDGSWASFSLQTFADPLTEFDVLMGLDLALTDLGERKGMLVTYNGRAHDLSVLRRRCARYWMFGLPGTAAASSMDHLDLMIRQRRGRRDAVPSLRDALAGLGISAYEAKTSSVSPLATDVRKCQTDVVATYVLALYEMAIQRGSPDVLLRGWSALSGFLSDMRPRAMHLENFRGHPLLRAARQAADRASVAK